MSSQPQRRGRPVTAPYSLPRARSCSPDGLVNLGGERPFADARHIGLGHRDDGADGGGTHAGAGGSAAGRRRRRSDKRIGAVIDVEHGALRAFEHHAAALGKNRVEQAAGVGDKGAHLFGRGGVLVVHFGGIERIGAEERVGDGVLLSAGCLDVGLEQRGMEQIDDAQAAAGHLVFVGRADAAAGGADLLAARRALGGQFDHAVVGQNDLGAIGDEELPSTATPSSRSRPTSLRKAMGSSTTPLPMTPLQPRPQHAAGNELEHKLLAADDDRMAGVVPAGVARHGREPLAEHVHNLALALVAPLGAQHHCCLCSHLDPFPLQRDRPAQFFLGCATPGLHNEGAATPPAAPLPMINPGWLRDWPPDRNSRSSHPDSMRRSRGSEPSFSRPDGKETAWTLLFSQLRLD